MKEFTVATTTKTYALEYSIADLMAIAYRRGLEGGGVEGEVVESAMTPSCVSSKIIADDAQG